MIILAGYWDIGYNSPLRESEKWGFMGKDFGIDAYHMIPVSGIKEKRGLVEKATLEEVFALYPDVPAVFLDENETEVLSTFTHPVDVIYVFGNAGYSPLGLKREGDFSLKIDTPSSIGGLSGDQAAALVLYDRFLKS